MGVILGVGGGKRALHGVELQPFLVIIQQSRYTGEMATLVNSITDDCDRPTYNDSEELMPILQG